MKESCPALDIREKDRQRNTDAMLECLQRVPHDQIKTVLDIRYGLGGWARPLLEIIPRAKVYGVEGDRKTFHAAWVERPRTRVIWAMFGPDMAWPKGWPRKFDLILADTNANTALKPKQITDVVSMVEAKWMIMTDVACSKLHLNYKSYGLGEDWDVLKYHRKAWPKLLPGWKLRKLSRLHHHAATSLWEKV